MSRAPLPALTSLRFFAAFAIVLFHIGGNGGLPKQFGLSLNQGVSFFFVLSGFVLFYNYPALPTARERWRFMLRRFARLWPAHVVGIALAIYVSFEGFRHSNLWTFLPWLAANVAMVQTWVPFHPYTGSLNEPSWSISVEFALYIFFLALIPNFARTWAWKLAASLIVALGLVAIATAYSMPWNDPVGRADSATLFYFFPPARLFEFVLGMCAGLAFTRVGQFRGGSVIVWTVIEAVAILLVFAELRLSFLYPMQSPLGYWLGQAYMAPVAAILMFVMAQQCGWISRLLSISPLVFLGEISYSIYLLHFPLAKLYFLTYKGAVPGSAELAGYFALLFVASALTYLLVEKPTRRVITAGASGAWSTRPQAPSRAQRVEEA